VPHGQARHLPLAVPGAVRGGLHPRLRRTDGDDRLHGRLRPGGLRARRAMAEPNHLRRVGILWLLASLVATPLVVLLIGPIVPPGNASVEAHGQVTDNTVLLGMVTPVIAGIMVYFGYAIVVFRARGDAVLDGPEVRGHRGAQIWWIA